MNGAEMLIASAVREGIRVCFANPGTTELPLVLALDTVPGLHGILCLHENVATGAADGYARMSGKPAMCMLHLGPGLANGLTNLHNARRAHSPIFNVIGEHASWHLPADPLLATKIEDVAKMVSAHIKRSSGTRSLSADVADAISAATTDGAIASLIVPHDMQISDAGRALPERTERERLVKPFSTSQVGLAAKLLKNGKSALLLGGEALSETGLRLAGRIAAATGAELICETFFARMERGGGLPAPKRLPYFPDQALELTSKFEHIIIAGTRRPVAFFGYPGMPSYLTSEDQTVTLAGVQEDSLSALAALADAVKAPETQQPAHSRRPAIPKGNLDAQSVSSVIAALQPENCIMMDEALTVGMPYFELSQHAPRFTHLMLTGGAIGQGPGSAAGAAVACPDRKVINFQSDGCGAYSVQAFWTEARENLDVVTVIGSNRSYHILEMELQRAGVKVFGPNAKAMSALDKPNLDWVRIAEGFGVPGIKVETAEALARELEKALSVKGPRLIEAVMA